MALSVVPLVVFNFVIMYFIQEYYMEGRIGDVQMQAVVMSSVVAWHNLDNLESAATQERLRLLANDYSAEWGLRILVTDDRANVIYDSNRATPGSLEGSTLLKPEVISALDGRDTTVLRQHDDTHVLNVAMSVHDEVSGRVGAVLLVSNVDDIFESVATIRNTLILGSLAVGLLVVVLVFVVSNRLITPLRKILKVVQRMSTGQLYLRIPVDGKDEYAILSKAVNNMTEKLEQVEKTREEFVSNVSHEMKTPLSAIKALAESILLQDSVPEDVYREFLNDINSEVDRMNNINNDLLALVKVDQREQGLNIASTNINHLVEDILKRLYPLAEQKKVVLVYEEMRPVQIDADEIKLALAISNIVENGIKYTPRGGTVRVVVDSDHQAALIRVQDTGIGIPVEEQDKIFNRFYRVDKARVRDTGGTGLGLAISRATVVLHNGSIRVNSTPDEGSVFTLRIPLRKS